MFIIKKKCRVEKNSLWFKQVIEENNLKKNKMQSKKFVIEKENFVAKRIVCDRKKVIKPF